MSRGKGNAREQRFPLSGPYLADSFFQQLVVCREVLLKIKLITENQDAGFIIAAQISYDVFQRGNNGRAVLVSEKRGFDKDSKRNRFRGRGHHRGTVGRIGRRYG